MQTKMKQLFTLSIAVISALGFYACGSGNAKTTTITSGNETISFYDVPLICNAAPAIGCGSRSKPALLELEKDPAVKEAWLNRQGTVIAIVWKSSEQNDVANLIFEKTNVDFKSADENESRSWLKNFRKENHWFRGADVDKLSIEEAGTIADRYVSLALQNKWITQEEADKIKPDVESYFKTELVKNRTVDELYNDSGNKFRDDVVGIFTKHIGTEKSAMVVNMYNAWLEECEKEEGCCDKEAKESCRNKK